MGWVGADVGGRPPPCWVSVGLGAGDGGGVGAGGGGDVDGELGDGALGGCEAMIVLGEVVAGVAAAGAILVGRLAAGLAGLRAGLWGLLVWCLTTGGAGGVVTAGTVETGGVAARMGVLLPPEPLDTRITASTAAIPNASAATAISMVRRLGAASEPEPPSWSGCLGGSNGGAG
jgi:hypothetical protein